MGAITSIEWTDASWTMIRARNRATGKAGWHCTHVSEACRNCYAERRNRWIGTGLAFKPGHLKDVEIFLDEAMLLAPLRWRKPRKIFVCSMTDLFGDFVSDEMIDKVFAVMALCPQHIFQVLTKRPERMQAYMDSACGRIADTIIAARRERGDADMVIVPLPHVTPGRPWWPLPNVWLGTSAEDQATADARIPELLATPAAVRFVSAEPMLGPIDFLDIPWPSDRPRFPASDDISDGRSALHMIEGTRIDWVICGGESGPHARPMHPDWARALRDQCAAAGVPFFFKQWGEWAPEDGTSGVHPDGCYFDSGHPRWIGRAIGYDGATARSADEAAPPHAFLRRVGKKAAGRILDGRTHDDLPSRA